MWNSGTSKCKFTSLCPLGPHGTGLNGLVETDGQRLWEMLVVLLSFQVCTKTLAIEFLCCNLVRDRHCHSQLQSSECQQVFVTLS